ncbi:MAG: AMIN domain-containing protein, partial [Deltaproteobacteria bacterium]|nr:AMIN domain-containing protein [Deltaproteobacteria bacterium]
MKTSEVTGPNLLLRLVVAISLTALWLCGTALALNQSQVPIELSVEDQEDGLNLLFRSGKDDDISHNIFTLESPPRLVIDLFQGTLTSWPDNLDHLLLQETGFSGWRRSANPDCTRIVFDCQSRQLPPFTQQVRDNTLLLSLKPAE